MNIYRESEIPKHLQQYFEPAELGLEKTPEEYVDKLVAVFREVRRVLKDDGVLWLNLGDSYAGSTGTGGNPGDKQWTQPGSRISLDKRPNMPHGLKPKDLIGIPWRCAFALQKDGWYLRQDIIWSKKNPMPESVTDRCTKSHEYIFLLTKNARYYYDAEAIKEDGVDYEIERRRREYEKNLNTKYHLSSEGKTGQSPQSKHGAIKDLRHRQELIMSGKRNRRSVWTTSTMPFRGAHFATFPSKLIKSCILAGSSEKGCCQSCGKPRIRETEKEISPRHRSEFQTINSGRGAMADQGKHSYPTKILSISWRPSCSCEDVFFPCIVLDPFVGSGTTPMVAKELGRSYLGIDLNPKYLPLINKRVNSVNMRLL